MSTPPPYGSTPGQPQDHPGQPASGYPQGNPTGPAQPAYGQPQYGQQQPGYPAASGYPAAQYGTPGYGTPTTGARPGMVTAAAVLAFVFGGFAIIAGIASTFLGSFANSVTSRNCNLNGLEGADTTALRKACDDANGIGGFAITVGVGLIIVAALLIWGGVMAISGKNQQILVIACAVYIVLGIVNIIALGSFGFSGILGFVAPVLILVFLFNPASKAWFKSKGAKTF